MAKKNLVGLCGDEREVQYYAVFVDTSLDTHLALLVSDADTVCDLKRKIVLEHSKCFPNLGDVNVHAIKIKRKANHYHLADSMLVRTAFLGVAKSWFLLADISSQNPGLPPVPILTGSPQALEYPRENQNSPTKCLPTQQIVNCKNDANFRTSSSDSGRRSGPHGQNGHDLSGEVNKVHAGPKQNLTNTGSTGDPYAASDEESFGSRNAGRKMNRKKTVVGHRLTSSGNDVSLGAYVENEQAMIMSSMGPPSEGKTALEVKQTLDPTCDGNEIIKLQANEIKGILLTEKDAGENDTRKRKWEMLNTPVLLECDASIGAVAEPTAPVEVIEEMVSCDPNRDMILKDDTDQHTCSDTTWSGHGTEKEKVNKLEGITDTDYAKNGTESVGGVPEAGKKKYRKRRKMADDAITSNDYLLSVDKSGDLEGGIHQNVPSNSNQAEEALESNNGLLADKPSVPEVGKKKYKKKRVMADDAITSSDYLLSVDKSGVVEGGIHQTLPSNSNQAEEALESNNKPLADKGSVPDFKETENNVKRLEKGKKAQDFGARMLDLLQKGRFKDQVASISSSVLVEDNETHNISEDATKVGALLRKEQSKLDCDVNHELAEMGADDVGNDDEECLDPCQVHEGERKAQNSSKKPKNQQISTKMYQSDLSDEEGNSARNSAGSNPAKTSFQDQAKDLGLISVKNNKIESEPSDPGHVHGAIHSCVVAATSSKGGKNNDKPSEMPVKAGLEGVVLGLCHEEFVSEDPHSKIVSALDLLPTPNSEVNENGGSTININERGFGEKIGHTEEVISVQPELQEIKSKTKKKTKKLKAPSCTAESLPDCPLEEQERSSFSVDKNKDVISHSDSIPLFLAPTPAPTDTSKEDKKYREKHRRRSKRLQSSDPEEVPQPLLKEQNAEVKPDGSELERFDGLPISKSDVNVNGGSTININEQGLGEKIGDKEEVISVQPELQGIKSKTKKKTKKLKAPSCAAESLPDCPLEEQDRSSFGVDKCKDIISHSDLIPLCPTPTPTPALTDTSKEDKKCSEKHRRRSKRQQASDAEKVPQPLLKEQNAEVKPDGSELERFDGLPISKSDVRRSAVREDDKSLKINSSDTDAGIQQSNSEKPKGPTKKQQAPNAKNPTESLTEQDAKAKSDELRLEKFVALTTCETDMKSSENRVDGDSVRGQTSSYVGHKREADDLSQSDKETLPLTQVHRAGEGKDNSGKEKRRKKKQKLTAGSLSETLPGVQKGTETDLEKVEHLRSVPVGSSTRMDDKLLRSHSSNDKENQTKADVPDQVTPLHRVEGNVKSKGEKPKRGTKNHQDCDMNFPESWKEQDTKAKPDGLELDSSVAKKKNKSLAPPSGLKPSRSSKDVVVPNPGADQRKSQVIQAARSNNSGGNDVDTRFALGVFSTESHSSRSNSNQGSKIAKKLPVSKELPLSMGKPSSNNMNRTVKNSTPKRSLIGGSGSIFNGEGSSSSDEDEGEGENNSDDSPKTSSDDVSSSDYSEGESKGNSVAQRDSKKGGSEGTPSSRSLNQKGMTFASLVKKSSNFKKTKLAASQSQVASQSQEENC